MSQFPTIGKFEVIANHMEVTLANKFEIKKSLLLKQNQIYGKMASKQPKEIQYHCNTIFE